MKKQILEEMAKEVSSDAWKLTKRSAISAAKTFTYFVTAPVVGSLNGKLKQRIYCENTWAVRGATFVSGLFNVPIYASLGELAGHGEDGMIYGIAEFTIRGLSSFFGDDSDNPFSTQQNTLEDIESNRKANIGSAVGYFPGKLVSYLFEKYDNAKKKIEGGGK